MKKNNLMMTVLIGSAFIAGCGSSGMGSNSSSMMNTSTTAVSGKVADGYLVSAIVFLDKNSNYQQDSGEPSATTDANGAYTLNISSADVGKYPIVAVAVKGQTIDQDTNQTVANSYMLSLPATAVSGTVNSNFISPMSTLIREKMAANPNMSMTDAMVQLRNQMNLPAEVDMMADYVAGSKSGSNTADYQAMHTNAQQMAGVMMGQSTLVMNGTGANMNRYRSMMATINSNMSGIAANITNGMDMTSAFMTGMMSQMQTQLGTMPSTGGFSNYSGMFRNMTSHSRFWSNTGMPMSPMSGGMMK